MIVTFTHRDNSSLFLCHYGEGFKFISVAQGAGSHYPLVRCKSKYEKRVLLRKLENPEILNPHIKETN